MAWSSVAAKTEPTYYTPDRVAVGKHNLQTYEWAQKLLQRIMAGDANNYYTGREFGSAADCIAQTDDFIWLLQPTTALRRKVPDHKTNALCPIHGEAVRKSNAWTAWTTDPIHHPYKVRCRAGGEWYPSNDFLNGDLTSGDFPDDGNGCLYNGKRYYFLIEYAHMAYGNNTIPCLRSLSQAWLLTGDKRYARAGCVLLARLASEYPNFTDRKDRLYFAPYGGRDPYYTWKTGGIITDLIWETFCLEATAYAYDGLYNYMDQDPELIQFLKGKGLPIASGNDLRRYIEDNIIRVGMQGLLNGYIHGNEGFHQAAALACALVLDDYDDSHHPNSKDLVEWAFNGAGRSAWITINGLSTDGGGIESPNYNLIKLDFIRVNRLMEEVRKRQPDLFPKERYPDLFGNPKGRAIFDHYLDIMINNDHLPSVGDCGGIYSPTERRSPRCWSHVTSEYLYAVERFDDPRFARACTGIDGKLVTGQLFEPYPAERIYQLLEDPASRLKREPRLLDGYGVALVESGEHPTHHALAVNYSAISGHRQYDNLSLGLWARGVDLLPDLGYPTTWDYRWEWDAATMAHNTVSVDETNGAYGHGGACNLFASSGGVHVVSTRHDPYPEGADNGPAARGVDRYERTTVMVDTGPDRFYVVDLFAVRGGELHTESWHGPLRPVSLPPLNWTAQPTGTLAGAEVAQFAKYTDRWGRSRPNFPCFLAKVRRAKLERPEVFTWDYGLPEGDKLNLHLVPVGGPLDVAVGTGRSPARPVDWALDYVLPSRAAVPGQSTYFLSVLDSFQQTPTVQGVQLVSEKPLTLAVARGEVTDEITLTGADTSTRTCQPRHLGVRVRTLRQGQVVREVRLGDCDDGGPGYAEGVIRAVDYPGQRLALNVTAERTADFVPGRYLRVFNHDRTAMCRIVKVEREGQDLWLTLDHTALLAEGPVVKTADGALWVQAMLDWGYGSTSDDQGALKPALGGDYFAGAWLGEGPLARPVQGAVRDTSSKIFLREAVPAATLEKDYGGKVISLWQYGVGDRVELARIASR